LLWRARRLRIGDPGGFNRKASVLTLSNEYPTLIERRRSTDVVMPRGVVTAWIDVQAEVEVEALVEARGRNARGHCVDGLVCDHPDHGPSENGEGVIHFIF
jgi:hypothetical protein